MRSAASSRAGRERKNAARRLQAMRGAKSSRVAIAIAVFGAIAIAGSSASAMNGAATTADCIAMAMPLPVSGSMTPEASPIMKMPSSTAERARKMTGSEERKPSCAGAYRAYIVIQRPLLGANRFDERVPSAFVSLQAAGVHEAADVRDAVFDVVHAEVAVGEGVELDDALRAVAAVVAFESEVAMRAVADEARVRVADRIVPSVPTRRRRRARERCRRRR